MQLIDIRLSKELMNSDCLHSGEYGANLYPASPDASHFHLQNAVLQR